MPLTTGIQKSLRCAAGVLFGVLPLLLAGCARGPQVTIPLQENAGKQYAYAVHYRDQSNLSLIGDAKRFLKVRTVVREHYVKVGEFFPGDRKFTPLAKLEVAEIDAGLDFKRITTPPRETRQGIKQLQALAAEYPDYDYIQAKTLYDQALCHQALRQFPEAMTCFQQVRDRFTSHKDKDIRDLARMAAVLYNKTHVNE